MALIISRRSKHLLQVQMGHEAAQEWRETSVERKYQRPKISGGVSGKVAIHVPRFPMGTPQEPRLRNRDERETAGLAAHLTVHQ
jgi:hypothetical protein